MRLPNPCGPRQSRASACLVARFRTPSPQARPSAPDRVGVELGFIRSTRAAERAKIIDRRPEHRLACNVAEICIGAREPDASTCGNESRWVFRLQQSWL